MKILRLHLASLRAAAGSGDTEWPVHGFVLLHDRAWPILVDTGVGGPEAWLRDWRAVNRSVAEALAEHDLSPADIRIVVNTHLHFDHCGQNSVFRHAPFYVQRAEVERARRESRDLIDWFDFAGARFELLDGDAEIAEGVRAVATPGHTVGHQSVVISEEGDDVLIGDAAYNLGLYRHPEREELPSGQAVDRPAWEASLRRLHGMGPERVHFCHDTRVHTGPAPGAAGSRQART